MKSDDARARGKERRKKSQRSYKRRCAEASTERKAEGNAGLMIQQVVTAFPFDIFLSAVEGAPCGETEETGRHGKSRKVIGVDGEAEGDRPGDMMGVRTER